MENIISLRNIVVEFDGEKILKNIDLDIRDKAVSYTHLTLPTT